MGQRPYLCGPLTFQGWAQVGRYPTATAASNPDDDNYVWAYAWSDAPMLAPAGVHTLPHACSLDESYGRGPELGTQVWVGHGIQRREHPASNVTYSNGMNFPMACAACAEEASTAIVFARVLQWKSSYRWKETANPPLPLLEAAPVYLG
jgi:hypothetical protein